MRVLFKNPLHVNYTMLNACVESNDLKPAMQQVCIDLKEKKLVVTDAHVLIAYPIEIETNETNCEDMFLVPPRFFNHLRYMVKVDAKNIGLLDYILSDEFAEVYLLGELVYRCKYADYKYPKWASIIPKEEDSLPIKNIGLHPQVLNKLCKGLPKSILGYEFIFTGQNKGILVKSTDSSNKIIAIVMPLMLSNPSKPI